MTKVVFGIGNRIYTLLFFFLQKYVFCEIEYYVGCNITLGHDPYYIFFCSSGETNY